MRLPEPDRPTRRSETRDLVRPIIVVLNKLPGVRVVRNVNLGPVVPWSKRFDPHAWPIIAGLGEGSADVVGVCECTVYLLEYQRPTYGWSAATDDGGQLLDEDALSFGRLFCLEVKLPSSNGKRKGRLEEDQARWLEAVRRFGGFAAVVRSVEEAGEAVVRCRRGESE